MQALADRILIKPLEPITALHITGEKKVTEGEVVSVGDAIIGSDLKQGMRVAYRKLTYGSIGDLIILREDEILAEIK